MIMSINDVDRVFNERDFRIMQWQFCRLYCEPNAPEQFTEHQLFLRSGVRSVMGNQQLMRDFVLDDANNIYTEFIRRCIQGLIDRQFVERNEVTNDDGSQTVFFRRTDRLRDACPQFMEFLLGDIDRVIV